MPRRLLPFCVLLLGGGIVAFGVFVIVWGGPEGAWAGPAATRGGEAAWDRVAEARRHFTSCTRRTRTLEAEKACVEALSGYTDAVLQAVSVSEKPSVGGKGEEALYEAIRAASAFEGRLKDAGLAASCREQVEVLEYAAGYGPQKEAEDAGLEAFRQKRYADAVEHLSLVKRPRPATRLARAIALVRTKDFVHAREDFKQACEEAKDKRVGGKAALGLGYTEIVLGHWRGAVTAAKLLERVDPGAHVALACLDEADVPGPEGTEPTKSGDRESSPWSGRTKAR